MRAKKYHTVLETDILSFPSEPVPIEKKDMLKRALGNKVRLMVITFVEFRVLTDTNVPGRNNIVTAAILPASSAYPRLLNKLQNTHVIIDELSLCVSIAIFAVKSAISKFVLLSLWFARLNNKLI